MKYYPNNNRIHLNLNNYNYQLFLLQKINKNINKLKY